MKLLDKQTIVTLKGTERKREVDEAVKLAKKVDYLRQTAAQEEANLAKFRHESIQKVKDEIASLIEEKDILIGEVGVLEYQKEQLQEPLDDEWDRVKEESTVIDNRIEELEIAQAGLNLKEKEIQIKLDALKTESERIKDLKLQTLTALSEAEEREQKATEILVETKQMRYQTLEELNKRIQSTSLKEAEVEANKRDLDNRKKILDDKEIELKHTERAINDKYRTLERILARTK